MISLPQQYRSQNYKGFNLIHKWANFIKHPKAFLLCHHPEFSFNANRSDFDFIIDNKVVIKYYAGSKRNADLYKKITNKTNVLVLYPSATDLMDFFVKDVNKIIPLIEENKIYKETLSDKATFEDYFSINNES
ncbi:hypothetical protein [Marinicella gelatinilytica]|uniref:hypothetical protein n=1 Tax=Marinicella gelatinilytica TaxID=2996017 RepID=UPI00226087F7|nr:hypothetical protein [Marinicella gelatinilytica]MCX7544876.1 hypothetical protein [Marinicella gelatinilytica]